MKLIDKVVVSIEIANKLMVKKKERKTNSFARMDMEKHRSFDTEIVLVVENLIID